MGDWRHSRAYRVWRAKVIRRDKRCVICGAIKERQAHHINHATYYQDLRFDPENGVTLCRACHTDFHTNFKRSYRQKCDRADWENFRTLISHMKERLCDTGG